MPFSIPRLLAFGLAAAVSYFAVSTSNAAADPPVFEIEVAAGEQMRAKGTVVTARLPVGYPHHVPALLVNLVEEGPALSRAVVVEAGKVGSVSWLLDTGLPAGEARRYRLQIGVITSAASSRLAFAEDAAAIKVSSGAEADHAILEYVKTPTAAAAEREPVFSRSGYIHPLYSPSGKVITGDYAVDHPHQHALFFAWTNCTFEGRDINFWDQKSGGARIRFVPNEKTPVVSGAAFTEFAVTHRHEDLSAPDGKPKPVLDETWQVRTWRPVGDYYVIDIVSTQTCASDSPLTINKYHYGGMAIRGTSDWFINEKDAEQPGDFLTDEGKTRADGNHSRPNWVDMHGPYPDGSHAGVAIFDHPDNFRFPQFVRLHPSKPYFVFTPQVEEGFEIKPGEPYVSRYRYIVHDGEPDPKLLDRLWSDYANPPKVTVVSEEEEK